MCRVWQSRQHSFSLLLLVYSNATVTSVRRRGKNVDSSSKSNPLRRRGKKLRREGVGVVVEKKKESRRTFNKNLCDLFTAITHTDILCAFYKTNNLTRKQNFESKTLDDSIM